MLGDEILPRRVFLAGVFRLRELGGELLDRVRIGTWSCCCIEPMPNEASNAERSNGVDVNSADVGDINPNASAESTSAEGLRGAIANSVERGDARGSVGVAASSVLCENVGTVMVFVLISERSGSTMFNDGTT